jgi:pimeloyl-ACP methyl ester carboxylesterase
MTNVRRGHGGDGATTRRSQLDGLADAFTVVAWDAPGPGRKRDPLEGLGMAGHADALIEALGLHRCAWAGSRSAARSLSPSGRHPAIPAT